MTWSINQNNSFWLFSKVGTIALKTNTGRIFTRGLKICSNLNLAVLFRPRGEVPARNGSRSWLLIGIIKHGLLSKLKNGSRKRPKLWRMWCKIFTLRSNLSKLQLNLKISKINSLKNSYNSTKENRKRDLKLARGQEPFNAPRPPVFAQNRIILGSTKTPKTRWGSAKAVWIQLGIHSICIH